MKQLSVARVIILDDQGYGLVLYRSKFDSYRPGQLDLPGGEIELGESPLQAVKRELFEEAGITLDTDPNFVYAATGIDRDTSVSRFLFVAASKRMPVRLSADHESYDWVMLSDITATYGDRVIGRALQYATEHNLLP